jgi:hypothetical protein
MEYEVKKTTDMYLLNSSVFSNLSLAALERMDESTLSKSQQNKLSELKFLLRRIGNIKINESALLLKLFENN